MKRHPFVVTTMIVAVLAGACSSGSDTTSGSGVPLEEFNEENDIETPTVPASDSVATNPVVTEPAPTSSSAPNTEVAPDTAIDTTSTVEGAPATNATNPSTPEELVIAAVQFFEDQWKTCLDTIPSCDLDAVVARRSGEERDAVTIAAAGYNNNGYTTQTTDGVTYQVTSIEVSEQTAVAQVCVIDAAALFESDGTTVVDDRFLSSNQTWSLTQGEDGIWTLNDRSLSGELVEGEEANVCADA